MLNIGPRTKIQSSELSEYMHSIVSFIERNSADPWKIPMTVVTTLEWVLTSCLVGTCLSSSGLLEEGVGES